MTFQSLVLLSLLSFHSLSFGAPSCQNLFESTNDQAHSDLYRSLHIDKYDPTEMIQVIAFIKKSRESLQVNPEYTADARYLFADFEDYETYYGHGHGAFFILKDSTQEILGTIGFTKTKPGVCELKKVYLSPKLRGQGMGRKLVALAITNARSAGFHQMVLKTDATMKEAIKLYLQLGFEPIKLAESDENNALYFSMNL